MAVSQPLVAIAIVLGLTERQTLPESLSYWYELVEDGKIAVETRIGDRRVSHILGVYIRIR